MCPFSNRHKLVWLEDLNLICIIRMLRHVWKSALTICLGLHQHFECNLERNSYCSNWTFINFSLDNNDPSFASPETILHILIPAFLHRHLQDTFEHNCVNRHFWDSIQRHCINVRQYIYQSDITIQYNINHTNINFPRYDHNLDLCYW